MSQRWRAAASRGRSIALPVAAAVAVIAGGVTLALGLRDVLERDRAAATAMVAACGDLYKLAMLDGVIDRERRVRPEIAAEIRTVEAGIARRLAIVRGAGGYSGATGRLRAELAAYFAALRRAHAAVGSGSAVTAQQAEARAHHTFTIADRSADRLADRLDDRATAATSTAVGALLAGGGILLAVLALLAWWIHRVVRRKALSKRERQVASETEQRYRALVEDASDLILTLAPDGRIATASGGAFALLGRRAEDLEGVPLADLVHPDDAGLLEALHAPGAVDRTLDWRMSNASGGWVHVETLAKDMTGDARVGAFVLTTRDISRRKAVEAQLRHRALHDPLTQLPNQELFVERVEQALADGGRGDTAVLFVDLDDFKPINDRLGHATGDQVLAAVAQRLRSCMRTADVAGRLGGDEFGVLIEGLGSRETALQAAERLLTALSAPVVVGGRPVRISPSIGVAIRSAGQDSAARLLQCADAAMYAAKRGGKGRYVVFDPRQHGTIGGRAGDIRAPDRATSLIRAEEHRAEVEALLRTDRGVRSVYQPIADLRTGDVAGFEALARFYADVDRPTQAWFAQAHLCGLGAELETAALRSALEERPEAGRFLSVNLSPSVLLSADAQAALPERLDGIVLELTENELVDLGERAVRVLSEMRSRGARIAVDDAGAGYAGLRQVMSLRPDLIKLDRSIVDGIHADQAKVALVESFVRFSEQMGAEVCAEGIEDVRDLRTLADLDVAFGQGFAIGYPGAPFAPVEPAAAGILAAAAAEALQAEPGPAGPSLERRRLDIIARRVQALESTEGLGAVLALMSDALGADALCFSRRFRGAEAVQAIAAHGKPLDEARYALEDYPLTAHVLRTHEASQVLVTSPSVPAEEADHLGELGMGSLLMLPVAAHGVSLGLIEAYLREARPWTRLQTTLGRAFAHELASVLEVIARDERRRIVARVLAGAPGLTAAFDELLPAIGELDGWDAASCWRADGEVLRCQTGWVRPGLEGTGLAEAWAGACLEAGEGLPGQAWQDGTPAVEHDLRRSQGLPQRIAAGSGLACGIAVPVRAFGQTVAVLEFLCAESRTGPDLGGQDLTLIADQAGFWLEHRRGMDEVGQHVEDLDAVARAARALAFAGDPAAVRDALCSAVTEVTAAPIAILYEADPTGAALVATGASGESPGLRRSLDEPSGAVQAFLTREPLFVPDVDGHPAVSMPRVRATGAQSCYWHPIVLGSDVLGVLAVVWTERQAVLPERIEALVRLLAAEAAIAIRRPADTAGGRQEAPGLGASPAPQAVV